VTRILIQGLYDMGYCEAARSLSRESHYELESPSVAAFRQAIMDGRWTDAEAILLGSYHGGDEVSGASNVLLDGPAGLVLAEGADKSQMLFWMRQQKFLEYLDQRELSKALAVLRQELAPLNHDVYQLHALSRQVIRRERL
jgi:WD repeat-containing protein 26